MFDVGSPIMNFFQFVKMTIEALPSDVLGVLGAVFTAIVIVGFLAYLFGIL